MTAVLAPERVAPAREFAFPQRESVHRLRTLREFLFKQGRLKEAVRIAQRVAEVEPGRETYWRWGVMLREAGRYEKALKVLRDALRFETGPAYVVPEIHLALAATWYRLQDYKRLGESLRRAYAGRLKPRSEANLHLILGQFHVSRGRYRDALQVYILGERQARTSLARGRFRVNQGVCKYHLQDLPGAIGDLEAAIEIHKRSGQVAELAQARYLLGWFHFDQGQFQRAFGMLTRAADSFERAGMPDRLGSAFGDAGHAALRLGDAPRAREFLDRALAASRETNFPRLEVATLALRATACAVLDDFEQATADLSAAKRRLKGMRDYASTAHVYRAQAKIAALFGDWLDVRRWALRAERYAQRQNDPVRMAEFRALRAQAEAGLGRRRAALHAKKTAERLASVTNHTSAVMRKILPTARRLAKSDLAVLLTGESGVGKTRLAQEMHLAGRRVKGPCVVVPCEQLSHPASDLTGHVQGAWSGAAQASEGYARRAAGGTLVLDRVDELSAEDQRFLIPVVEGRVRAVGSAVEEKIDCRIIATCRDAGRLIPELRQRLAGAVLVLPPLRERVEDLPSIIRAQLPAGTRITLDALAELASHPWPGNRPELESALERLAAAAKGAPIGVKLVRDVLRPAQVDARDAERRRLAALAAIVR